MKINSFSSLFCCSAILFSPCHARSQDSTELMGHQYWINDRKIEFNANGMTFLRPGPHGQTYLKAPANALWLCYGQGASWALEKCINNEQGECIQRIWRSIDEKTWEIFGELPPSLSGAIALVPLKAGRLLMVPSIWHWHDGQWSPLYVVSRTESGSLEYWDRVLLDLGEPFTLRAGFKKPEKADAAFFEKNKKYLIYRNLNVEHPLPLYQVGDGFFLVSKHMGVLWYFNGDGVLKRRYKIFDEMRDENFSNIWAFSRAIVACQVSPENKLVFASRSKEAVFLSQQEFPTVLDKDGKLVESKIATQNDSHSKTSFYNSLNWWEINPESEVPQPKAISAPVRAPLTSREVPIGKDIQFSFRWDGLPQFGNDASGNKAIEKPNKGKEPGKPQGN